MSSRASWRGLLGSWLLRLQAATWRKDLLGVDRLDAALAAGEPLIAVFWHGSYQPLFALLRDRAVIVFTSISHRGDVIAEICRRFGYLPVQIPDHGRDTSLARMRRALAGARGGAIAVDGPLGPYHVVKRGAIQLASDLGSALFPIAVASSRHDTLVERWDRMEVPRLFSRVVLEVGEPLAIPPGLGAEEVAVWCERVGTALDGLQHRVDARLAGGQPVEATPR